MTLAPIAWVIDELNRNWFALGSLVHGLANDPLWAVTALCLTLLALVLVLTLLLVLVHIVSARRERELSRLRAVWTDKLHGYLNDEVGAEELAASVPKGFAGYLLQFLADYLRDIEGSDRRRLVTLIRTLGQTRRLRRMVRSGSVQDRCIASYYLGLLREPAALRPLRRNLRAPDRKVRYAAAEALIEMGDDASLERILSRAFRRRDDAGRLRLLLFQQGPRMLERLPQLIARRALEPQVLTAALDALGHYAYSEAWPVVVPLTRAGTPREVRLAALRALAAFGDPQHRSILVAELESADPVARSIAARAMGELGSDQEVPRLLALLRDEDFWVVSSAVCALIAMDGAAMAALQAAGEAGLGPVASALLTEALARRG